MIRHLVEIVGTRQIKGRERSLPPTSNLVCSMYLCMTHIFFRRLLQLGVHRNARFLTSLVLAISSPYCLFILPFLLKLLLSKSILLLGSVIIFYLFKHLK